MTTNALTIRDVDRMAHRRFAAGAKLEGVAQAEFLRMLLDAWEKRNA